VSTHRTKLGSCSQITQNPYNAIINLGHANGTVTLWSPALQTPLVKILCHRGPITGISCDFTGHYMSTSGLDGQLKVWDIRTYKELDSYYTPTPPSCITYSQKGLLGVASNGRVTVWKDLNKQKQKEPYMTELLPSCTIENLKFCPFEDILGVGHSNGFSSIVIPGIVF
jgi:U3 small nucleolar RNA-associated protein 7